MSDFESYILESQEEQQKLFQLARSIILNTSPVMREHFSYGVPFFSCYGKICYFNRLKVGIDIGFVRGNELSDPDCRLNADGRKQVKSIRIESLDDFDEQFLTQTIHEALVIDELHNKKGSNG